MAEHNITFLDTGLTRPPWSGRGANPSCTEPAPRYDLYGTVEYINAALRAQRLSN